MFNNIIGLILVKNTWIYMKNYYINENIKSYNYLDFCKPSSNDILGTHFILAKPGFINF